MPPLERVCRWIEIELIALVGKKIGAAWRVLTDEDKEVCQSSSKECRELIAL